MLQCPNCGRMSTADNTYCRFCGEPIDPALIAELQWHFGALNDLDSRIARGEGEQTITTLRDKYRERYFAVRHAPVAERPVATAGAPNVWEVSPAAVSATPSACMPPVAPVARVAPDVRVAQPRPAGPVFSWQAFLSEQAIAIMMYMGGFLGLVAMLSFEIGGWQSLDLSVKLGAIILVYAAFGTLGLVMRRLPRLHTVGGAYLGVFALMTPLLALGIYRFGLQAAGFSAAAMLSLSAAYAAIIYLALAWRTRFVTYAYLGWSALILSLLAAVFWADAPGEAIIFALAVASVLLLLPGLFRRFPSVALLETPALQLGGVTSVIAAAGTLFIGLVLVGGSLAQTPVGDTFQQTQRLSTDIYALAAGALVLVACGWSYTARRLMVSLQPSQRATRLNVLDWLIAATASQAVIAVAAWAGADRHAMSIVLSLLALTESGLLFALWQRVHERKELQYLVEALVLALTIGACLTVASDPAPNWLYLLALTVGVAITGGLAFFGSSILWLLPAGLFLSLDYHALFDVLFHPLIAELSRTSSHAIPVWSIVTTVLVVALVIPWQFVSQSSRTQRYAMPAYVVALGNAVYAVTTLIGHDPFYATAILGLFVALALLAGWRAHQPVVGGFVAGAFGFLLPLPLTLAGGDSRYLLAAAVLALVMMLAALGVRALIGRSVALPAYLIALWCAVYVTLRGIIAPPAGASGWNLLGVSLFAWLLLAFALLQTIAVLWDDLPWALFIPALFALLAAVKTSGLRGVALTVALVGVGMLLRQMRGRLRWSISWYIAALLASLFHMTVFMVQAFIEHPAVAPERPMYVALLFALVAYLAAAVERKPGLTYVVPLYVFLAALTANDPQSFAKTLAITYGLVVVGVVLRLRVGRSWALASYLSAIVPSLIAIVRATPHTPGVAESLLLIFAVTAYAISLIERAPLGGIAAVVYAGAAAIIQPDAHALLPLSLALAAAGIAIGRVGGWRWAWPAYAASLVAAIVTAVLGYSQPGFEGWALLLMAVVVYLIAMIESQAELLVLAMFLGVLALVAGVAALGWAPWQVVLAFVGLSWLYIAGQWLWAALPWLRVRSGRIWWMDAASSAEAQPRWQDMRQLGRLIHHAAGLLVGCGVVVAGLVLGDVLAPRAAMTQVEVVALLSLAAMIALSARTIPSHVLWYVAGGLLAVAISWQVRWFGADNIQAFVLAPGSYLLAIGALLPADHRLRNSERPGQIASLMGALLLLLPTLTQSFILSFTENWIYAGVLAVEALVIAAIGVGTHMRALILLGTGFFGLAAIRGAMLAFTSGVPVALIIAVLALLLMGGATWLSLRGRRETGTSPQ